MTYIVGILIVVFLGLTILVVSRLQNVLKGVDAGSEDSSKPEGNSWNAWMFMAFLVLSFVGFIWSYYSAEKDFLPEASSIHGRRTDDLFWFSMAILTIAFFIVNFLIFYFSWKYQYKKGNKATFYPENHKLELIWTVIPAIVMALLVFTGWKAWSDITSDAPKDSEVFEIMGKQFGWYVRYPGVDNNKLGNYNYKLIDSQNEMGLDLSDENSFDDFISVSELHVPVDKPVLLKIRARDVLHSVFIPHMRVKMDAVPGMPTKFWFIPDKTTAEMRAELGNSSFDYEIACTEVCGRGHFAMRLRLIVEDEASYRKWCAEQKTFLETYPEYLAKVPDNLKPKAMKYMPEAAPSDSTTAQTTGIGTTASFR
ncbi:cytochrome c oxidase subunit II [Arundinibacter roseus]|uniref:Cytochrome c oxidase subunit 2 n=1 Tax=Arundinibacter roseus TaxID=2070510 RepID=A0A4R4K801_9BACT|nr:cytochrome c oxidase subunit II [Arundinibacter roseus]TDB63670.1 cytochrome c oxidase subunit II [Arundinibacter roseus]